MGCAKRYQSVYLPVAAQALDEITCNKTTKTVANYMNALVASSSGQLADRLTKP